MPIGSAVLTRALQKVGSWHNINIGAETLNVYGDGSYSFTAFSGEGIIFTNSEIDTSAFYGIYPSADAVGYFDFGANFPTGSKITVTFRGNDYEVMGEPIVPTYSGNDLVKIIALRKFVP